MNLQLSDVGNDGDILLEDIDCNGHIVSPGYIDIHLNGAYGVDFLMTEAAAAVVERKLLMTKKTCKAKNSPSKICFT